MDLVVVALVFGAIFLVELPDKTFVASLVLSTRFRPLAVWLGIGAAFLVQTLIAVLAGHLTTYLPADVVRGAALVIFLVGAVVLVRAAPGADAAAREQEGEYAGAAGGRGWWASAGASFLVLFAAEWGDLSQLLTISLVARYDDPVSVFLGAWGALLAVSGLAVLVGRWLQQHVRLSLVHYAGAVVCLALAAFTAYELFLA